MTYIRLGWGRVLWEERVGDAGQLPGGGDAERLPHLPRGGGVGRVNAEQRPQQSNIFTGYPTNS